MAGAAVDFLRSRDYKDAPVRVAMIATLFALPPIVVAPLMNSEILTWVLIGLYLFFISSFAPLVLLAVSGISSG